jgi:hypothetical protein
MKPPVLLKSGRALVKDKRRFFVFDSKAQKIIGIVQSKSRKDRNVPPEMLGLLRELRPSRYDTRSWWLFPVGQGIQIPGHLKFTRLVFNALTGNPKPLYELLLSKPALSDENWEDLVWLIETLLARSPGRPHGHTKHPVSDAKWWIVSEVKASNKKWLTEHGRKRVPKAVTIAEIERLKGLAEEQFPAAKGKISTDHILSMLK